MLVIRSLTDFLVETKPQINIEIYKTIIEYRNERELFHKSI